ncbi:MAG TPA: 3'-5' exonuclease, partial [bacterium]|nr:3'-5' exonuclease [bacterium]
MIYYEQDNNYKLQIEELNRLLETRQKTNECLNLKKFFSVDYSNVSNPFLIESFNVFIAALKELLSPANEIIINHTNNVKLFYCAQILKKLFEFLEMKVVITDITAPAEFISLKIKNSKFEICSQPLLDSEKNRKKVVEISDKNYYWNIKQNTWCESIFKFSLGLLYSFDETYNKELIVYDLEATGLTPADEITEIGAVKIKNGVILKKFQTLVNPKKNIPRDIQLLTNITNDMVRSAPDIKQAMQMFIDFAGADIKYIVVHNGSFDIAAVRYRLKKYFNINFSPKIYDTRQLSQSVKPGTGLDLSSLSLDFDVNLTNAHRALADAEATSQIFIKLVFLRNVKISIFFKDNIS